MQHHSFEYLFGKIPYGSSFRTYEYPLPAYLASWLSSIKFMFGTFTIMEIKLIELTVTIILSTQFCQCARSTKCH